METCAECGKPIEIGQGSYYRKNPTDDLGQTFHSTCGDPLGIDRAVAKERKRCADIARFAGGFAKTDSGKAMATAIIEAIENDGIS
jgi:hypothetical protein